MTPSAGTRPPKVEHVRHDGIDIVVAQDPGGGLRHRLAGVVVERRRVGPVSAYGAAGRPLLPGARADQPVVGALGARGAVTLKTVGLVDPPSLGDRSTAGRQPLAVRLDVDIPEGHPLFRGRCSESEAPGRMLRQRDVPVVPFFGHHLACGRSPHNRVGRRRLRRARGRRGQRARGQQHGRPWHRRPGCPAAGRHSKSPRPKVTTPSAATFHPR